jgi:membrane associated rhomboid family serine protease
MFPLNDTEPNRYSPIPWMTIALIFSNTFILFFATDYTWDFIMRYGSTAYLITHREGGGFLSSITSMFLHGGLGHLASNMWALWVFGRRVEDACGSWRYLAYYLFAGILGDAMTALVMWNDQIPGIGASGAIFGVMGAYLLLFPEGRIRTLVILQFIPAWPRIRAGWVVLYFLAIQIIPAINMALVGSFYGVGYWAHLGGFMACLFISLFLRPEAFARYLSNVHV